jgi:hypothetical protein
MAQTIYNIHKDRVFDSYLAGRTFGVLLLKATVDEASDSTLDTVEDLLSVPGVLEADFTNYARKTITITSTLNDSLDAAVLAGSVVEWENAGGATDNIPQAAVIYETGATDALRILVGYYDSNFGIQSTNGGAYRVVASELGVFL